MSSPAFIEKCLTITGRSGTSEKGGKGGEESGEGREKGVSSPVLYPADVIRALQKEVQKKEDNLAKQAQKMSMFFKPKPNPTSSPATKEAVAGPSSKPTLQISLILSSYCSQTSQEIRL